MEGKAVTTSMPARKPLEPDAFFKTMRSLNPSKQLLEDLEVVERITRERAEKMNASIDEDGDLNGSDG